MKFCFVCSEYPPGPHGGIGTMTQVWARRLVQAGHEARVIGIYHANDPGAPYEDDHGVRVWRLRRPPGRLGWVRARIALFRQIRAWTQQRAVELIEAPDFQGWTAGWPRLPVPVVARLHGSCTYFNAELGLPIAKTLYQLERRALKRADFLCSVSRYTAERTREVFDLPRSVSTVLYNPVEFAASNRSSADAGESREKRVVFSGTLHRKKGVISLIQAWPLVHRTCPDASLHLYGKDIRHEHGQSMRAQLEAQLSRETARSVHFHGHIPREDLGDALRRADIAVFPSYAEAFALAPLEAMSHGCPTIYSHRGSGPELIEHERNGLLVEPDRPEEIAVAILRLLQDPPLAEQLGQAGQQHVRASFALERLAVDNEAFYRGCLDTFHSRSCSRLGCPPGTGAQHGHC